MDKFEIKLNSKNYERIKKYYDNISINLIDDITYHWSKREIQNLNSFIFKKNYTISINNSNNSGLDHNYKECFFKKEIKNKIDLKTKIKKNLFNLLNIHSSINFNAKFEFINSDYNQPIDLNFVENEFGENRKDFTIFKSVYILNDMFKSLNSLSLDNKKILEIGPGVGNLMRVIFAIYKNPKLFMIDLEISLLYSIINLIYRFPNANYILPNEINSNKNLDFKNLDFIFLTNKQMNLIPTNIINNVFNTMSFQEMTKADIEKYFNLLRRVLLKKNYFYCLNAVEKEMLVKGQKQFIRFSEYPWSDNDKIIEYSLSDVHKNKTTKPFFRKIITMTKNA